MAISGNARLTDFLIGQKTRSDKEALKEASEERFFSLVKSCAMSLDEILVTDFPERRKIVSPWIQEQSIILMSGFRGVGKSIFTLGLCDAISRGGKFGPWEIKTSLPILYVDGEMVISDIQKRARSMVKDSTIRKNPVIYFSDFAANLKGLPKTNLTSLKCQAAIKRMCLGWKVKLLVLDNISSLCPNLDENVKSAWDPVNQWLLELRFNDISTIMLHHVNKEGGQRGTSGREDNVDISLTLERPKDYVIEDGARFITKFTKARIPVDELPLISDCEFQLKSSDSKVEWVWTSSRRKRQDEVIEMLEVGMTQGEIAAQLGASKPYVCKVARTWKKGGTG